MYTYFFSLLLCILPAEKVVEVQCEKVELQHFYDDVGRLVFDQLVYYEWADDRYQVVGWKLLKYEPRKVNKDDKIAWEWNEQLKPEEERLPYVPPFTPGPDLPRLNPTTGWYEAKYYKDVGSLEVLWHIRCKTMIETWSQQDIELVERQFLPKELRPFHPLSSDHEFEYTKQLFNIEKK